ncbi:hypothetical protein RIF29_28443 [Crotalaria pallida]|uniref:Uncharacterized protein n=1 Tax=Crotalaria pallida TaxID=3830 RepID=A0AAN9HZD1_CROPI
MRKAFLLVLGSCSVERNFSPISGAESRRLERMEGMRGSRISDVFVRVLEVVAEVLTEEDHLREDIAARIGLVNDLKVEKEEPLNDAVLGGEDVADDGDEKLRDGFAVVKNRDGFLQSFNIGSDVIIC